MQRSPRSGGASGERREAPAPKLFATFKLATPYVEMVRKSAVAGQSKTPANINRVGLIPKRPEHG